MPEKKSAKPAPPMPTTAELHQLLTAAIDGIDGYESEHGDLRYWNPAAIQRARHMLDSIPAEPAQSQPQTAYVAHRASPDQTTP